MEKCGFFKGILRGFKPMCGFLEGPVTKRRMTVSSLDKITAWGFGLEDIELSKATVGSIQSVQSAVPNGEKLYNIYTVTFLNGKTGTLLLDIKTASATLQAIQS